MGCVHNHLRPRRFGLRAELLAGAASGVPDGGVRYADTLGLHLQAVHHGPRSGRAGHQADPDEPGRCPVL